MYYSINFTPETQAKLWRVYNTFFVELGKEWDKYMDHITIIHSSNPAWETAAKILSNFEHKECNFRLIGIGYSDNAVAFRVNTNTANEVSHITIAVRVGHKPVESNQITKWEKLYCNEEFSGTITFNM